MLIDRQVVSLRKTFVNNLSANIKLSKTQMSKIIQSGEFLGRFLGALMKDFSPFMKKVFQPLAKSVFIPLGLAAVALGADAGTHKKLWFGDNNVNNIK